MTGVRAFGIEAEAPPSWEVRIFRLAEGEPTLHASSFPLPLSDGEFGADATRRMRRDGAFVSVTEYRVDGKLTPGQGLFAPRQPRALSRAAFSPNALLRGNADQLGTQMFFTAAGRPFALYAVVGSPAAFARRLPEVNALLATLAIDP